MKVMILAPFPRIRMTGSPTEGRKYDREKKL